MANDIQMSQWVSGSRRLPWAPEPKQKVQFPADQSVQKAGTGQKWGSKGRAPIADTTFAHCISAAIGSAAAKTETSSSPPSNQSVAASLIPPGRTQSKVAAEPTPERFDIIQPLKLPADDWRTLNLPAASDRVVGQQGADGESLAGWRVYFMTHQPGEWWLNEGARAKFAEIYGERALVTLDYTCTVPENVLDPMWVTNLPLDEDGRPLPRNYEVPVMT